MSRIQRWSGDCEQYAERRTPPKYQERRQRRQDSCPKLLLHWAVGTAGTVISLTLGSRGPSVAEPDVAGASAGLSPAASTLVYPWEALPAHDSSYDMWLCPLFSPERERERAIEREREFGDSGCHMRVQDRMDPVLRPREVVWELWERSHGRRPSPLPPPRRCSSSAP